MSDPIPATERASDPAEAAGSKDVGAGLICLVIGGAFAAYTLARLNLGSGARMGPGAFPLILAATLAVIGLVILVRASRQRMVLPGQFAWRGLLTLSLAPVAFALTLDGLGFIGAVMLLMLISSFASSRMQPVTVFAVSASVTALCVVVFYYGLGVTVRLVGSWFGS